MINRLADQCKQHGFSGINLDLEDLNINDNALLVALVKDFATVSTPTDSMLHRLLPLSTTTTTCRNLPNMTITCS